MTTDTSIGLDYPIDNPQSGIDDEARERTLREGGDGLTNDDVGHDLTREDIEQGNDQNTSADQGNRSGKTNRIADDMIELGK